MKLVCEIEVPDNADFKTKLDAMASAAADESKWREVKSSEARRIERMMKTDLCRKCGSCKFFESTPHKANKSYGICHKGYVSPRSRSTKACTLYEKARTHV